MAGQDSSANHPVESAAETVEPNVERSHPLQRLFLLDVWRDRASRPVIYWALGTLLFGTVSYHWIEGWSYLDSVYFCVITLATIGYGDLTPTTDFGKMFTILYAINGIGILLAFFDRVRNVRQREIESRYQRQSKAKTSAPAP